MDPKIFVSFRFHGNFYHSYRGDTPDELGFGKDIRIIRHLIESLDALNAAGIPVRGTWDFENYFSLETIMPAHCPELIDGLQRRARQAGDEMQLMSYNNGLINAHTAGEFEAAIRRGISNPQGSGLRDLFGQAFYPMVRPQEMMYTPIHLQLYRRCGIEAISLYYSALPFNGFSNFIPLLSFTERYNPLTLTYPGIDETMTLIPCYNAGDLIDHLSLRRWVKGMRREQQKLERPLDLLLLVDMDADDEFWVGYPVPLLSGHLSTIDGLKGMVQSVAGLEYVEFTTPGDYLKTHPALKSIAIHQDTADGSFDGLSSWVEKWSNQRLWTGLERARILDLQTRRLVGESLPTEIQAHLDESFEARLKLLSTTHFGMAAPVMNLRREAVGRDLAQHAVESAALAFAQAFEPSAPGCFSLLDYRRGLPTESIAYPEKPSRALLRLALRPEAPPDFRLLRAGGAPVPSAILERAGQRELLFVDDFAPGERKDYRIEAGSPAVPAQIPVIVSEAVLENEFLRIELDQDGQCSRLLHKGSAWNRAPFLSSAILYGGRRYDVQRWQRSETHSLGLVGLLVERGELDLPGGHKALFERQVLLAAGLPYLYIQMQVFYPRTPDQGYSKGKALRLQQAWDNAWQGVMPCEVSPDLAGSDQHPLRVWKHNFCDHVSSYDLDYGRFSKNETVTSANNQVTHAWTAVSDGRRGLLAAQSADSTSGMAFCPLQTWKDGASLGVRFNPFGTYWGKQYHYASGDTGLGNFVAQSFSASDHINPYAPSYNGRMQEFRLLLAPYEGDAPPQELQRDAEAFGYPSLLLNDQSWIADPPHRSWDGRGLGESA